MSGIARGTVRRLINESIKKGGMDRSIRISKEAVSELKNLLEKKIYLITKNAVTSTKNAGKKTISRKDVKWVIRNE